MLGNAELLVALAVAFLLFGPERLPRLARQVGATVARIREALEGGELSG